MDFLKLICDVLIHHVSIFTVTILGMCHVPELNINIVLIIIPNELCTKK